MLEAVIFLEVVGGHAFEETGNADGLGRREDQDDIVGLDGVIGDVGKLVDRHMIRREDARVRAGGLAEVLLPMFHDVDLHWKLKGKLRSTCAKENE